MERKTQMMNKLADLTPAQRALLEKRLQGKGLGQINQMINKQIQRRPTNDPVPLSSAQQRIWVMEQFDPGIYAYNIPVAVRMQGQVDLTVLERTLQEVIRRHESLRTTFATVEEQPVQVIAPALPLALPLLDLRASFATLAEREAEAERIAVLEAQQPFSLERGPLLRALVLQLDADDYLLVLVVHHIVSDGWSMGIVIQEMCALYSAYVEGQSSPLPELTIQYGDFAVWQRDWLKGEQLQKQLAYWQQKLGGALPILQLSTDYPRPAAQTYQGAKHFFHWPQKLVAALHELGQAEGATLFMLLMAVYNVLLYRYTGQQDLLVGTPIAGRNRAEIEPLIGVFVNTLVMRTEVTGDATFRELLARVRQVAVDAYANQDVPFEQLVDVLQPERNVSHPVLVQTMFVLQNTPLGELQLPGLELNWRNIDNQTSKFDITLNILEQASGMQCELEYNTALFAPETIARMADHLTMLVAAVVENPDQKVALMPLLTAAERQLMLIDWNNTASPFPLADSTVHGMIEAQVERTPDAVALEFAGQTLTYRELNSRANRLAHRLRKAGVGPEIMVGICMERSLEMVIGLVGILKAGGAYVPIDPSYPTDRIAYVIEDTATPVLLTQQHLLSVLPPHQAEVICLDSEWAAIATEEDSNPVSGATPDTLAYVIYTSGSTGKPKGVLIPHANVVRLFRATEAWYRFAETDVWTLFHSFAFDFSVWELWGALFYGGKLVVVPYFVSRSPEAFYELLVQAGVTVLNQTPSAFRQLIQAEETVGCHPDLALRYVIFGGEALELQSLQPWLARHGDQTPQLVNMYGITETTVHVTYRKVTLADVNAGAGSVIGVPIPDLQVYVLDSHLQPVPFGVPGELYVGGAGVARGYLHRPELTAERFVANPFAGDTGARLYKTGDLARWLSNGELEYLGRLDHQVKVRGFRIELGEIEATLLTHPAVQNTVVMAREDVPGIKRLVAYLLVDQAQQVASSDLRQYVTQHLPEYMVPSFFVLLDQFPLSPNGKVDRKALPAPEVSRPEVEQEYVAAQGDVEEMLAQIWAKVLGLQQVGVNDNFFELGGDSILAIQVVNKAKQAGLQVSPKQLFEYPSIAKLARVVGSAVVVQAEQGVVTGDVALTPIQHYFWEEHSPEPHYFNQAVLLEVRRALDERLLEQAVRHLLEHHDALRMRYVQAADGWRQVNAGLEEAAFFTRLDLAHVPVAEQEQALEEAVAELHQSLDLTAGPLVRAAQIDLGAERPGRLLLVIHHLVVDGVSWRILLEDLHLALDMLERGQTVQLPPKTTSFQLWAERLQDYAQLVAVEAELPYWTAAGRESVLGLPVDNEAGVNDDASMRAVSGALTAAETQSLLQEVPSVYNTQINDALLTGLAQALTEWSGASSVLVALEGHGREALFPDVDLSRTVGWFTTVFPVLLTLRKTASQGEKLKAVKEQLRAVPNRGIGYGLLRYLNKKEKSAGTLQRLPQAEVVFNYLGQLDQVLPDASPFATANESAGLMRTPLGKRRYLLEIDASIASLQLQVRCHYSENVHQRATVERVVQAFLEALRAIIAHCKDPNAGGYTPSDFSKAKMNQKDLNKLLGKLSKGGK